MRISKNIILALTIIVSLFVVGCEDVIEIDLNSADPKIVIEGAVANDNSPTRVQITKSTDFYEPGIYDKVTGAEIEIIDSEGNSGVLTEIEDGLYETEAIVGEEGRTYYISVRAEGEDYSAESSIPRQINIDSLHLELSPFTNEDSEEDEIFYSLHIFFQDYADNKDYARFRILNNGQLLGGYRIYNDKYTNGNYINYRMDISAKDNEIKVGDELTVQLLSIDKASYDFYLTANDVNASGSAGGPGSIAPANPVTNWTNDALGVFTAFTVSTESVIVEE